MQAAKLEKRSVLHGAEVWMVELVNLDVRLPDQQRRRWQCDCRALCQPRGRAGEGEIVAPVPVGCAHSNGKQLVVACKCGQAKLAPTETRQLSAVHRYARQRAPRPTRTSRSVAHSRTALPLGAAGSPATAATCGDLGSPEMRALDAQSRHMRAHLERGEVHGDVSDHTAQRECVADDPPGTLERRGWYKSGRKRRTEAAVATVREHIVTGANLIARAQLNHTAKLSIPKNKREPVARTSVMPSGRTSRCAHGYPATTGGSACVRAHTI